MKTRAARVRLRRFFCLWLGLILVLLFPGDRAQAVPLRATSVSIALSNPACVQVHSTSDACSIQIDYVIASGSDPTFSRLEILVNSKLRVYMPGFFESFAYLTHSMIPDGLRVTCGRSNASGLPDYGQAYTLTANAYMVDGTSATDSMTVFCPAFDGRTYLPLLKK